MRNHVKRFLSVFLVSLLLSQEVLADVTAPAVPIGSVAPSAVMATASDAITAEGEPFSDGDTGKGEYMPDNILSRYEESFDYCPITPDYLVGPRPYVAVVDDVVILILCCLAAACGILLPRAAKSVSDFFTPFDTWLRRTCGNVPEIMTAWYSVLTGRPGEKIMGLKLIIPKLHEYMRSSVTGFGTGSTEISFNTGSGVLKDGPYFPDCLFLTDSDYSYLGSTYDVTDNNFVFDIYSYHIGETIPVAMTVSGVYFYVITISPDTDRVYNYSCKFSARQYIPSDNAYKYWTGRAPSYSNSSDMRQVLANCLSIPVFNDVDYCRQYAQYGYLDGIVEPDPDFTIKTEKAWSDLQQDFFNKYAYSDVLTIPETQEEFDALYESLTKSVTGTDVITNLKPIWDITEKNGGSAVSPTVAYTGLSYTLDAIASYVGVTSLDASLRNGFIADYFNIALSGLTIDQLNTYAQTIVNSQISIKGTAEDHDANNFVVTAGLTSAFLSYLLSAGLIDSIPEIKVGTQLKSNVKVETKIDTGTTTPDSGTTDLTGILGILSSILSVLGGLPGLIAAEIIKSLTSSAFANGITLNLDTIRSSLSNIAQWDFADWTTALGAAMLLALKSFAADFRLGGFADALDSIAQWDFADWDTAFGSAIKAALMALGIDRIAGLADVLKTWDFSDWSSVFRSVLDAALVSSGLAGLAGILTGIKDSLKGLGISIDLSPLTDALTGLKDAVISIPGQITDFFTIDTAVIADAFVSLQTAFTGRFSGITQLASVFDRSYSFDIVYPVIKIPIPEEPEMLRVMFDGKAELVFLDLNPFAENLAYVRNLLIAMLYVSFAFWFLGEFDVKFHIG